MFVKIGPRCSQQKVLAGNCQESVASSSHAPPVYICVFVQDSLPAETSRPEMLVFFREATSH